MKCPDPCEVKGKLLRIVNLVQEHRCIRDERLRGSTSNTFRSSSAPLLLHRGQRTHSTKVAAAG
jgi:hypothetical protein